MPQYNENRLPIANKAAATAADVDQVGLPLRHGDRAKR